MWKGRLMEHKTVLVQGREILYVYIKCKKKQKIKQLFFFPNELKSETRISMSFVLSTQHAENHKCFRK